MSSFTILHWESGVDIGTFWFENRDSNLIYKGVGLCKHILGNINKN